MASLPLDFLPVLIPVIFLFLFYAYERMAFRQATAHLLFTSFAAGAFAVVPPALFEFFVRGIPVFARGNRYGPLVTGILFLVLIALPEEGAKFIFLKLAVKKSQSPAAAFVSFGIALGLGFVFIENFLYADRAHSTLLLRSLTALPLHAAAGGLLGRAVVSGTGKTAAFFTGAVILHGMYNLLVSLNNPISILAPIFAIIVLLYLYRWRQREDDIG